MRSHDFFVCEGLSGSGKTTLAEGLGEALDLTLVPVVTPEIAEAIAAVDHDPDAIEARHALYGAAALLCGRHVRSLLDDGVGCVTDSWIYRTNLTHLVLGSSLKINEPPWFPQPRVTLWLDLPAGDRAQRIAARGRTSPYWKARLEEHSDELTHLYADSVNSLELVDARGTPEEVLTRALELIYEQPKETHVLVREA